MGKEKMTMEKRIDAFYRQSGGPQNTRIPKLLERHLLYGKDHGMPGYKETFEDAIIDTLVGDASLLLLFERFQRWRLGQKPKPEEVARLEERIGRLERELRELRKSIDRLIEAETCGDAGV